MPIQSNFKKSSKESKISIKYGKVDCKENEEELYSRGYIATTHVDSVGDKIQLETLNTWAEELNSTNSMDANPVSIHHNRSDTNVAGLGASAKVETLEDGEHGLWVETHHNKEHPDFSKTKYEVDNKFLSHYSIEYDTNEGATTHKEHDDNYGWVRVIEPSTDLLGYGLASPRTVVNSEAKIVEVDYKELISTKKPNEVKQMKEAKEEPVEEPKVEETPEEPKEEAPAEEKVEEPVKEEEKEKKEEPKVDIKEIAKGIKAELKEKILEELKEKKPENAPMVNKGDKMEKKERKLEKKELEFKEKYTEFKEGVLDKKASVGDQWKIAARMETSMKEMGLLKKDEDWNVPSKFEIKENQIEMKTVTTDSDYAGAQTTYLTALANYEQTPARYNDIYGPVIVNQLNDETALWNLLTKEDWSGMSAIRFRARTGRNTTADTYSYGSTPGWDSKATIKKYNVNFVTSYVEVAAEFEAIEFGMGAGGIDVYANEIKWATKDLMTYLNASQLFSTGDGTAETESLGLDGGIIIVTGNLYGKDVTTNDTNLAAAGVDAMSSAAITLKKLREMIRDCVVKGARRQDLFFCTSYLQYDFIKALIQDMQRIVPTSAKVGFEGVIELDGVPIFPDKDLDANSMTDDVFLLDRAHTKIAMKKAPTYVEFGLTELKRKGIIWMMWNLYSDAPSHNYRINGLATS